MLVDNIQFSAKFLCCWWQDMHGHADMLTTWFGVHWLGDHERQFQFDCLSTIATFEMAGSLFWCGLVALGHHGDYSICVCFPLCSNHPHVPCFSQPFRTAIPELQQIGINTSEKSEGCGNKFMGIMLEISRKHVRKSSYIYNHIYQWFIWFMRMSLKKIDVERCRDINLVGGFKHCLFSIVYGIILPIDFHIFQDG